MAGLGTHAIGPIWVLIVRVVVKVRKRARVRADK